MAELGIRRVVVAGDASSDSADALPLAAELAFRWQVGLHGLFVEDAGLLALADLPFARELGTIGASGGLERAAVERQLASFAARARRYLAEAAERRGVRWSFEVVRGSLPGGPLPFQPTDFLVLEALSRPFAPTLRIASPWSKVAQAATQSLLLLRDNRRQPGPVLALIDEAAETAQSTLTLARWLAEIEGRKLTVAGLGDVGAISHRLAQENCRILVMSRELQERAERELPTLTGTLELDVLLV